MSLLADVCAKFGALHDRTHLFSFAKVSAPGVTVRFTRDLRPLPATGLTGGHLLEVHAILDERHPVLDATAHVRFDVLEEDFLLGGGLDDRIVSLLGTGAVPPETGAPTRQLDTQLHDLPEDRDLAWFVEQYKRTLPTWDDTLLVVRELPPSVLAQPASRRTHVLAWLRVEHDDVGAHSELYAVLDVADGVRAASPVLEIEAAPPGVSVRLRGSLVDAAPLAGPEPLADVPATLGGRRAVSGAQGDYVLDARLPVGDHPLRFARPGVDPLELTVRVTADAANLVTAAVLDAAGTELVRDTTTDAATEQSVLALAVPDVQIRVHKLRGTVRWPESRRSDVEPGYRGSPLAERRVYVLPVPAGTPLADARPKTTRAWEQLKRRADVLRSCRPGRPAEDERTDASGRFEVRYVDLTPGARYVVWVERLDPVEDGDTTTESPDLIVRTYRASLEELFVPALTTWGRADLRRSFPRNLVDHEYTQLTGECVPLGVDVLRVEDVPAAGGLSLGRPPQTRRVTVPLRPIVPGAATRATFEKAADLDAANADLVAVPASRTVGALADANAAVEGGLDLAVLPLVPLYEPPDLQGGAARRAAAALSARGTSEFADYVDLPVAVGPTRLVGPDRSAVRLVIDTARLAFTVDAGAPPVFPLDPVAAAREVELLESTYVVRPQLATGRTLGVEDAWWHSDAVSLADGAFVRVDPGTPTIASRMLIGAVHPVLAAVSPLLPALAARGVYVAPGHGLWPTVAASVNAAQWRSDRGGYAENAGEDEVDALLASELARILLCNGATVKTCRQIHDFTEPAVSEPPVGGFPPVKDVAFPRRWQQNAYYHLGASGDAAAAAGNRNFAGIDARVAHIRAVAGHNQVDLIYSLHTNGDDEPTAPGAAPPVESVHRGFFSEYLGVAHEVKDGALRGEGNPLGLAFSSRLVARLGERLRTGNGRVWTMNPINSQGVADLFMTYHHWYRVGQPEGGLTTDRLEHGGAGWAPRPFPDAAPRRLPVSLTEHGHHDNRDDARLLSRTWYRRLAAEAGALAIDAQLQAAEVDVSNADVQAVLGRTFGETDAVRALPLAGPATAASIAAGVHAVSGMTVAVPNARLSSLATAALTAARGFTRRQLVELMRDALRTPAGWLASDMTSVADAWIARSITDGRQLERQDAPPTRADAAAFACLAVGLTPASLEQAERHPVGTPPAPLLAPARVVDDRTAFFSLTEAGRLVARLAALGPKDVHRVVDAYLANAALTRLASTLDGVYELDQGTPLTIVVRTAGIPWKTATQDSTNGGVDDVEIRVMLGETKHAAVRCAARATRTVVGATWLLDLTPSARPVQLGLQLWIRHRTAGTAPLHVGTKVVSLLVREPAAP